eukprot:4957039-Lingulodinium_polyedra.AAC.1
MQDAVAHDVVHLQVSQVREDGLDENGEHSKQVLIVVNLDVQVVGPLEQCQARQPPPAAPACHLQQRHLLCASKCSHCCSA